MRVKSSHTEKWVSTAMDGLRELNLVDKAWSDLVCRIDENFARRVVFLVCHDTCSAIVLIDRSEPSVAQR